MLVGQSSEHMLDIASYCKNQTGSQPANASRHKVPTASTCWLFEADFGHVNSHNSHNSIRLVTKEVTRRETLLQVKHFLSALFNEWFVFLQMAFGGRIALSRNAQLVLQALLLWTSIYICLLFFRKRQYYFHFKKYRTFIYQQINSW